MSGSSRQVPLCSEVMCQLQKCKECIQDVCVLQGVTMDCCMLAIACVSSTLQSHSGNSHQPPSRDRRPYIFLVPLMMPSAQGDIRSSGGCAGSEYSLLQRTSNMLLYVDG